MCICTKPVPVSKQELSQTETVVPIYKIKKKRKKKRKKQRERQLHSEMLYKLMWVWSYTIKQAIYQTHCEQLFETLKF